MKNTVIKLLQNTWGLLLFALLCGCAYFAVILRFILSHTEMGGGLLAFFFMPLIVCGAALIIIKIIKQCMENGRERSALALFWAHIIFIALAAVFAASIIL